MAFKNHYELFKFVRVSFGLKRTPEMFWLAIDIILSSMKWHAALLCLGDILFFLKSVNNNMLQLHQVFTLFPGPEDTLKLEKSSCFPEIVSYLQHIKQPGGWN